MSTQGKGQALHDACRDELSATIAAERRTYADDLRRIAQAIGEESTRLHPSMAQLRALAAQVRAVADAIGAEHA